MRVSEKEQCSREEYERNVRDSLKWYLEENVPESQIRCFLTIHGIPLKVAPPKMTPEEGREFSGLKTRRDALNGTLKGLKQEEDAKTKEVLLHVPRAWPSSLSPSIH